MPARPVAAADDRRWLRIARNVTWTVWRPARDRASAGAGAVGGDGFEDPVTQPLPAEHVQVLGLPVVGRAGLHIEHLAAVRGQLSGP